TSGFNPILRMIDEANVQVFGSRGFAGPDVGLLTLSRGGTYTITVGSDTDSRTGTYGFRITNVVAQTGISFAAGVLANDPSVVLLDTQTAAANALLANTPTAASPQNNTLSESAIDSGITLTPFTTNLQTPGKGGALLTWIPSLTNAGT